MIEGGGGFHLKERAEPKVGCDSCCVKILTRHLWKRFCTSAVAIGVCVFRTLIDFKQMEESVILKVPLGLGNMSYVFVFQCFKRM